MIGQTVGHYRIVSQLGRGASGTVYRAVDETLGRDVAIKILHPDLADPDALKRFHAEATILARLNHPAITTIHELFWSNQDLVMVMELVAGVTLDGVSDRLGPLPPDRAAGFIDHILSALAHAHQEGVVHRDMKPANVMVSEAGAVKVMDFGIASMRGADQPAAEGSMMGTPAYMPPEQILNEAIDGRSDLYAVGVIFYRLLTGALPFEAETPIATLQRQISEPPAPMTQYRGDLPEWCDTIVRRALAKSPADRFQTADAFRAAIAEAAGTPVPGALPDVPAAAAPPDHANDHRAAIERTLVIPRRKPLLYVALSSMAVIAAIVVLSLAALHRGVRYVLPTPTPIDPPKATVDPPLAADVTLAHDAAPALEPMAAAKLVHAAPDPSDLPARPIGKVQPPSDTFETKTLVGVGARQYTRDARLLLTPETVDVRSNDAGRSLLYSVAYRGVRSITYSHGPNPMWYSPTGAVAVSHDAGMLSSVGILVERHWIALATNTKQRFIVLRVADAQVDRILSALQEHTGLLPQRLAERKRKRES